MSVVGPGGGPVACRVRRFLKSRPLRGVKKAASNQNFLTIGERRGYVSLQHAIRSSYTTPGDVRDLNCA
jgi:hypothetical protein